MEIKEYTVILHSDLKQKILELQKTIPSAVSSNQGGWQGVIDHKEISWVESLRYTIEQLTNKKTQRFWFNINGYGNYNNWHRHFSNCSAAVLYIDVPLNSGNIEFRHNDILKEITPKPGTLLVFPGTLEHRVLPNLSQEYRISLATNLV
jgi:phosphatidylserine decarboxylase